MSLRHSQGLHALDKSTEHLQVSWPEQKAPSMSWGYHWCQLESARVGGKQPKRGAIRLGSMRVFQSVCFFCFVTWLCSTRDCWRHLGPVFSTRRVMGMMQTCGVFAAHSGPCEAMCGAAHFDSEEKSVVVVICSLFRAAAWCISRGRSQDRLRSLHTVRTDGELPLLDLGRAPWLEYESCKDTQVLHHTSMNNSQIECSKIPARLCPWAPQQSDCTGQARCSAHRRTGTVGSTGSGGTGPDLVASKKEDVSFRTVGLVHFFKSTSPLFSTFPVT